MAEKLNTYTLRDWQNGMNDSVANAILPDNYLRRCFNMTTDEMQNNMLGDIKQVKGTTLLGTTIQSGKSILGLGLFIDKTQTPTRLIATVNDAGDTNSHTYYLNSGTWTEIGNGSPVNFTQGVRMRFATFLDYIFAVNGTDTVRTWDGNSATTWGTTNAVSAPIGSVICNFNDVMNIAGVAGFPSRLYQSSVPSAGGTITWTGNYVEFSPDDNDSITALEKNGALLMVFKRRSTFLYNGSQTTSDPIIDVGTPSQECVQTIRGTTFFPSEINGSIAIFAYNGQYPTEISRPIRKWLNAITTSQLPLFGSWKDEDHYYVSVGGNVTYEGITYNNVYFSYCVSKGTWFVGGMDYPVKYGIARVDDSSNLSMVIGNTNGQVLTFGVGNTWNGTPISSHFITKQLEFGNRFQNKNIQKFVMYSTNPQGASVRVRIDSGPWKDLGSLQQPYQVIPCDHSGRWFEFMVALNNNGGDQWIFDGFDFVDVNREPVLV